MLGDGFRIAAGLIDHQHAVFGAGPHIDRVVAGAIGGDDEKVRRPAQQLGTRVVMRRQLVAGGTHLIGMGGGENLQSVRVRALLLEHVEPDIAALAEHFAKTDRPVRLDAKHALVVDRVIHRFPSPSLHD